MESRSITASTASTDLSDILVIPENCSSGSSKSKRKPAINSLAVCISDLEVLQQLKDNEEEKQVIEQEKVRKRQEREEKKKKRELEKELKQRERLERKRERLEKTKKKRDKPTKIVSKRSTRSRSKALDKAMKELGLSDSDDDCECPKCKLHLDDVQWICCDSCDVWFHTKCTQMIFLTFSTVKAASNMYHRGPR